MANVIPTTTIVGNLTGDPMIYGEKTKNPRAVFTIAHNSYNRETEAFDIANFFQMSLFGEPGLNFAASHTKGDRVFAICRLGNYSRKSYDEEGESFNLTQITLNAITAGATNEFDETQRIQTEKAPERQAAKAKRPSPKAKQEEEPDEEAEEETEEDQAAEETEEKAPAKSGGSSGGARKAPARRAPRRRAPARS